MGEDLFLHPLRAMHHYSWLGPVGVVVFIGCGGSSERGAGADVPGSDRTARTAALETGAAALQARAPIEQISMYLSGFHPMKDDPTMQMESHHYCNQVNEDLAQCVLFDGNGERARLHGVEFIISEALHAKLSDEEKPYWHPHNYEILSGTLRLPGLPDAAEDAALKTKVNSYGKTWHVWYTGAHGEGGDALPLGAPHLAWSFNGDGEAAPELVETRDQRLGLDTAEARQRRAGWAELAHPQSGVNAMAEAFPQRRDAPAGVRDAGDTKAAGVPRMTMQK